MAKLAAPCGACHRDGFRQWLGRSNQDPLVDPMAIAQCQKLIGYEFLDPALLKQSLTHSSVAATRLESNERLEFLGDAVLGLVVCHELYRRQSDFMEGDLTKIKSSVVSRHTCAAVTEEIGICDLLRLGKGMPGGSSLPTSVAAAVFESLIGAVYLDGGFEAAKKFILERVGRHIDEALENAHKNNYKSLLQQYSQKQWSVTPSYMILDEKGPDHSKCFEIAVSINGQHYPSAWGKSKKEAEQEAARRALAAMGVIEDSEGSQA